MAVGFRSASDSGGAANSGSTSVSVPAGAASGDVVVVFLSQWNNDNPVTAPTGFTLIARAEVPSQGANELAFWKRLTGADAGSYDFSWSGSAWAEAQAVCVTGAVSTGDPIEDWDAVGTQSDALPDTTVTTATAAFLAWHGYTDNATTHTPPTGYTEVADVDVGATAYLIPGTSGAHTATGADHESGSNPVISFLVAVAAEPDTGEDHSGTGQPLNLGTTYATGHGTPDVSGEGAAFGVTAGYVAGTGAPTIAADGTALDLAVTYGTGQGTTSSTASGVGQPLTLGIHYGTGTGSAHISGTGIPLALAVSYGPGQTTTVVDPELIVPLPTLVTVIPDLTTVTVLDLTTNTVLPALQITTDVPDLTTTTKLE